MQSEISESVQRRRWLAGSCSAGAKGVAGAARGETAAGVTETGGGDARRDGCALRRYGYAARTASSTAVSQLRANTPSSQPRTRARWSARPGTGPTHGGAAIDSPKSAPAKFTDKT